MDKRAREMPQSQKSPAARLAGRLIGVFSATILIITCVFLLVNGQADVASYPAAIAGILGYLLLRPGKRSVRINMGGVVVDVISDDTGVIKTGTEAVVAHITHEISERTLSKATSGMHTMPSPPPIPRKE